MSKFAKVITIIFSFLLTCIYPLSASQGGRDVEVGFSQGKTAKQIIISAIEEAKISIDIAAYSFTSKPIVLAIVDAQNRGVHIRIVADKKSNCGKYTAVTYLTNHRIPVRLNDKYAIMHNKFMIIDGHSVQTGSFNYTQSAASRNAENVIYLRNQVDVAEKYIREFNRLWNEAVENKSTY